MGAQTRCSSLIRRRLLPGRPDPDLVTTRADRGSLAGSRGLEYLVWGYR